MNRLFIITISYLELTQEQYGRLRAVGRSLRLTEAGFDVTEDEPLMGCSRFYVADPFGNRIELMELV